MALFHFVPILVATVYFRSKSGNICFETCYYMAKGMICIPKGCLLFSQKNFKSFFNNPNTLFSTDLSRTEDQQGSQSLLQGSYITSVRSQWEKISNHTFESAHTKSVYTLNKYCTYSRKSVCFCPLFRSLKLLLMGNVFYSMQRNVVLQIYFPTPVLQLSLFDSSGEAFSCIEGWLHFELIRDSQQFLTSRMRVNFSPVAFLFFLHLKIYNPFNQTSFTDSVCLCSTRDLGYICKLILTLF